MDDDGSDVLVLSSLAFFVTLAESCVVATVLLTCRESFDDDDGLVNPDAAKGAGNLRGIDATRAILRIFVFKYFSSRVFLRLLIGLNPLVDFLTAALLPASPPSCLLPTVRILKEVASDMAEAFAFVGDTLIMHLIMLFVWFVAYVGSCVVICLSCGKFDIASLHSFALFACSRPRAKGTRGRIDARSARRSAEWPTTDRFSRPARPPPREIC